MIGIRDVIGAIKARQAEIAFSLGVGNASTWESYQRFVGVYLGHQEVLDAINRRPSKHPIAEVVKRIRQNNFVGFNFDLVYGLPLQTLESFKLNIEKVIALSPDRIVTFSYAHVPWVNALQEKMTLHKMPSPEEKINMLIQLAEAIATR